MPIGISDKNDYTLTYLGYKIVSEMKITGVTFTYEEDINFQKQKFHNSINKSRNGFQ